MHRVKTQPLDYKEMYSQERDLIEKHTQKCNLCCSMIQVAYIMKNIQFWIKAN